MPFGVRLLYVFSLLLKVELPPACWGASLEQECVFLTPATVEQVNFEIVLRAYTLKVVTFQEPLHFVPASEWGSILRYLQDF